MKTLELKAYGVQEMNRQEMVETEGGVAPLLLWGLGAGLSLLLSSCIGNKYEKKEIHIHSGNGNTDQQTQTIGHGSGNSVDVGNGKK